MTELDFFSDVAKNGMGGQELGDQVKDHFSKVC